jgi:predicted DNA-binding transcriptional regulator AlpA
MSTQNLTEVFDDRWLRLSDIVGDTKAEPPIEALIPVSRSTIYRLIAAGKFPAPVKPLPSISLWSTEEIHLALKSWGQGHE